MSKKKEFIAIISEGEKTEKQIEEESVYVLNKLSSDYEIMRSTHIPSILKTVSYNERMQNEGQSYRHQ